jgi:hypothetical protein
MIRGKLPLQAFTTSELVLDDVRLPADALLPEATLAAAVRPSAIAAAARRGWPPR